MASTAGPRARGPLARLDQVGSGWLLGGSLAVLVGLLLLGVLVHVALAPELSWDEVAVGDDFRGQPVPLQDRGPEHPWEVLGTWEAVGGVARTTGFVPGAANVALLDLGSTDGVLTTTGSDLAPGWGLVFRYQDPANHWQLLAEPELATWFLQEVVDGVPVLRSSAPLDPYSQARADVGVRMAGEQILVEVDGRELLRYDEAMAEPGATRVGMLATKPEAGASRWADLLARTTVER